MYDTILKGGTIIDGTGKEAKVGDVGILGDKIQEISQNIGSPARATIDCRGMAVTPGFVDAQNHSDAYWLLTENPGLESLLLQGFTTIVVGHCGVSLAPIIGKKSLDPLQRWQGKSPSNVNWESFADFTKSINQIKPGINTASFTGLSTLLWGCVGEVRPLDSGEIKIIKHALEKSLDQGSLGLSVGFSSSHEWIAAETCMRELLSSLAEYKKTLSVHLRDYGQGILGSLEEILTQAKEFRVRTKISHLKIENRPNWPLYKDVIKMIENSAKDFPVGFDVYPYDTTHQSLKEFLPPWVRRDKWKESLNTPEERKRAGKWMEDTYDSLGSLFIASTKQPINAVNKTISTLAHGWDMTEGETAIQILTSGEDTLVFNRSLDNEQVLKLCEHPLSAISTDGGGFPVPTKVFSIQGPMPHIRSFSTAPKFFYKCFLRKNLNLPEAIRKLTGQPAGLVGLSSGLLKVGNSADINVININAKSGAPSIIHGKEHFEQNSVYVFVNGQMAVSQGKISQKRYGKFIRN